MAKMNDMVRKAFSSLGCVRGMARLCNDGWAMGWHERNGGNASYRLDDDDLAQAGALLARPAGKWVELGVCAPELSGARFLVTASGSYMRNVADDPAATLGLIEVNDAGGAYRVLCGFDAGARPTSELAGHLLIHAARVRAEDTCARDGRAQSDHAQGACVQGDQMRVVYHAHPTALIALCKVLPPGPGPITRALWGSMTECVMVFPEGVGYVGLEVPGSLELARASAEQMSWARAVVWAHHGLLCTGDTFDDAFGRMHAIVKAAEIYQSARMMSGGCEPVFSLSDEDVRRLARGLGVELNERLWQKGR